MKAILKSYLKDVLRMIHVTILAWFSIKDVGYLLLVMRNVECSTSKTTIILCHKNYVTHFYQL
jgi:hypothetical protein